MELYGKNSTSTCNLEELGGVFSKPLCEMINIIYYFLQHYYLQQYHTIGIIFLLAFFFIIILLPTKLTKKDVVDKNHNKFIVLNLYSKIPYHV